MAAILVGKGAGDGGSVDVDFEDNALYVGYTETIGSNYFHIYR